jgi:RNA polymerase sigma-70 factor (ECF subfamily)
VRPTQEDQLEVQQVWQAFSALPEPQRAALLLITVEEMSYEEAAGVLGIPVGTLMSRIHRGRERLRRLMDAPGAGGGQGVEQ